MAEEPIVPPYPPDTRAKGWRFELDYERIDQSDTWSFAAEVPLAQHALLMMWLIAWKETPCGSLPSDESAIRAKCRIPPAAWAKMRDVLMRGWVTCDDGRMYHATITVRVLEMLEYRRKNAERVAKFKAAKRDSHAGNALPMSESPAKNDTGTGTGSNTSSPTSKRKARASTLADCVSVDSLVESGFDSTTAAEFIAYKSRVKAALTKRAWVDHLRESANAGWSPMAAAEKVMARSWKGFEAKYVADEQKPGAVSAEPAWRTAERDRVVAFAGRAAERRPTTTQPEIFDVDARVLG